MPPPTCRPPGNAARADLAPVLACVWTARPTGRHRLVPDACMDLLCIWRSDDVGRYVELAGGLVKITAYTSATLVQGVIVRELTSAYAVPADAWALKSAIWKSRAVSRT